jgi:predicted phosphoadenosine phosphosulfate sulfurtransferase
MKIAQGWGDIRVRDLIIIIEKNEWFKVVNKGQAADNRGEFGRQKFSADPVR